MEPEVKVNEDFKSQFKAYQEQQQRRLRNLLETKKEKQDRQKSTGSTKETVRALSDLNLFKKGPPVKEDASKSFLEAENKQLQDQLREIRDENCRLYRLTAEQEFEIKELQKRVRVEKLALSEVSGLTGDVAATKIVELAKKNREVTAEFESERAKVKQLNHRVKELERELQAAAEKIHCLGGDAAGIKDSALKKLEGDLAENPEVKALQEKLNTANLKVTEYRNQLQNLKQELKLTQKILAKEVGEDVNIQSLLTNSGNWRGRAQQILLLQTKVHELEHKLNHQKIRASLLEMDEGLLAFPDPRKLSVQEKNLLKIRSLEKEKKESLEKLSEQHNTLQKNHEELKKKLDASRARNQMLCGEVKMLKGQIGTLLEKGKHDDELIQALLSQQKQMQEILKGLSQKENKESQQMMGHHLSHEIQKQNTLIDELRGLVADREEKVKILEKEIGQLTNKNKSGAAPPLCYEYSGSPEGSGSSKAGSTEWGEESSDKVTEAEKKLHEEQWQSDSLEQQLEKLQVDPGSSTTAQELALRSRKGEGEPSATATSPMSPLGFIDSDNIGAPPAKASPVPDLARGDGTCSEPAARQEAKSWLFFTEEGFPTALRGTRSFAGCFHGIIAGEKAFPCSVLPPGPELPLHSCLRDSAEG
ncbi:coiled-coil domain-containing protein 13 isoform X4 [Passer domesticus]|uniref:coiled-coil domain-containing protein 13 isoform X4 n=1 Tax=Passer domesticus TaxID=48849 RepID=UPI0030FE6ABA